MLNPLPTLTLPPRPLPPFGDAAAWAAVPGVPLVDVTHGWGPEQGTTLRVARGAEELRVRFEAVDTEPWATLTVRDAPLYTEEVVEVFLDPVGDLLSYYEIEVNPRNAVLDLVVRRTRSGLRKDPAWHCAGLRTHVAITPRGWEAELALPLASLAPEPPAPGAEWRANFCRIDRPRGRARELSAWSATGRPLFHVPERFGTLKFS